MKIIGILLIALGIIGVAYGGITWTQREEVADLGPIEITKAERKSLPIPPIAGGIALVAGVLLLTRSGRRRMAS